MNWRKRKIAEVARAARAIAKAKGRTLVAEAAAVEVFDQAAALAREVMGEGARCARVCSVEVNPVDEVFAVVARVSRLEDEESLIRPFELTFPIELLSKSAEDALGELRGIWASLREDFEEREREKAKEHAAAGVARRRAAFEKLLVEFGPAEGAT